jgi:hypothetical protein
MGGTRDPTPQTDTLVKQVWYGHAHDLVTRRLFPYIRPEKATSRPGLVALHRRAACPA